MRRLNDEFGTTILVTTHLMEEADELGDRVGSPSETPRPKKIAGRATLS